MGELTKFKQLGIEKLKTPDEANLMRAQIEAAKKLLPQVVKDRNERWDYAFEGNWAYVEASIKAGELWNAVESRATQGTRTDITSKYISKLSTADAGFKNSVDATMCSRLASFDGMWKEKDIEDYKNECDDYHKQPSLG